jgi:hypothetical protein
MRKNIFGYSIQKEEKIQFFRVISKFPYEKTLSIHTLFPFTSYYLWSISCDVVQI